MLNTDKPRQTQIYAQKYTNKYKHDYNKSGILNSLLQNFDLTQAGLLSAQPASLFFTSWYQEVLQKL